MSEKERPNISCGSCVSACCLKGAATLKLNQDEVEFMRAPGTELEMFLPAGPGVNWGKRRERRRAMQGWDERKRDFVNIRARWLKPGYGLYGLASDCQYLERTPDDMTMCGAHDDERRPGACNELRPGSDSCRDIRERRGVGMDTEEINLSLVRAALGETAVETFDRAPV